MGFFDSLMKAAKDVVNEVAASSPAALAAACAVSRPDGISGEMVSESGYSFEKAENIWDMGSGSMEIDRMYHVAFDEDDADELYHARINIGVDSVASQHDAMKNFKRAQVSGNPIFFECVTYNTEDRVLSGIPVKGVQEKVYRFKSGSEVKNLSLAVPNNCPPTEADYARKAFELMAATFRIN